MRLTVMVTAAPSLTCDALVAKLSTPGLNSSSTITSVAVACAPSRAVAAPCPFGFESASMTVSLPSTIASSMIGTTNILSVSPSPNTSTPVTFV